MNTDSFISLTTDAFENIAGQFGLAQKISKQEIDYSSSSYKLSIYFENYFEINVYFSFNYKKTKLSWGKTKLSLSLNDLAKYLGFDEQTIQHIQHNQIADEEYYKYYISKIAEICEQVIKRINSDSNLMLNCYNWKVTQ